MTSVTPSPPRYGLRGHAIVAGQHDDAQTLAGERFQRRGRSRLDRIGNGKQARERSVDCQKDNRRAIAPQAIGIARKRMNCHIELGEKRRFTEPDLAVLDNSEHAFSDLCVEVANRRQHDVTLTGSHCDDGPCERMLARLFDTRGESHDFGFAETFGRKNGDDARLPLGQSSRLVEHQGVDIFQPLERFGISDENARVRATPHAHHDRHGGRKAQRAGTGDDEHAHGGHKTESKPRFGSIDRPCRESRRSVASTNGTNQDEI